MANNEETGSHGWGASFFMQTTEDMARAVAAAATAVRTPRPSVVFSSKSENGSSQIQKLRHNFSKLLTGLSSASEVKSGPYNPEVLTSQKRQWANFQLQHLDNRSLKEPTKLFENMVVVGLHPDCDLLGLGRKYAPKNFEGSGKSRSAFIGRQHQSRVEPSLEPQVLFVYPPDKQLPLKCKDLLSFCFPEGVEVKAVERTPSMSELNEILLGQEHLKQSDQSFVFRLQVADDSTLYGCCVLVEEMLHKPSRLISMITEKQRFSSPLSRHVLTTRRCYCILSRLPFFELHFGVLNSIFTEERLERLTRSLGHLNLDYSEDNAEGEWVEEQLDPTYSNCKDADVMVDEALGVQDSVSKESTSENSRDGNDGDQQASNKDFILSKESVIDGVVVFDPEIGRLMGESETSVTNYEKSVYIEDYLIKKQVGEKRVSDAVPPLLRHYHYESSESSSSIQGSPSEDRNFRSDIDDTETEDASFSGQEDSSDYSDILKWAKENGHGSLELICEYYRLCCPPRGSTIKFHPLEHLYPLEYLRPDETVLHTAGSTIDLKSCNTSLELAEAHNALVAEEEAVALSVWSVACICGSLRLDNLLTVLAGALLEKQIVFVCSNLGFLSGSVLSIVPLIRPYQWQSLLMPVLPNDMLDFLDAPVPYIVGIKNKTSEVQSKLTNLILVDINKNQVKSQTVPKLPKQKQLYSSLSQYHAKLFAESNLVGKRPVYECTDVQIEAAKGLLSVLRSYMDSLCSSLRFHTITNVQSNDDKVSLLLKESFIDSFPNRDRPFMKQFVDTQLFSVHTDLILSFFEKE